MKKNIIKMPLVLICAGLASACVSAGSGGGGDSGTSWKSLGTPSSSSSVYEIKSMFTDSSNNLYIGGVTYTGGGVWKYTNGSWVLVGNLLNIDVNSITMDKSGNLYAAGPNASGTSGSVYKYTNNTWNLVGGTTLPMSALNSMVIDGSNNIYASGATSGSGIVGVIYKYANESWTTVGDLTDGTLSVYSMAIDPLSNDLYAGTRTRSSSSPSGLWKCRSNECDTLTAPTGMNGINTMTITNSGELYVGGYSDSTYQGTIAQYVNDSINSTYTLPIGVTSLISTASGAVYAGGFNPNDSVNGGVYQFGNNTWSAVGGSIPIYITAISVNSNGIPYSAGERFGSGTSVWTYQ